VYRTDPLTQKTVVLRHRPGDPTTIGSDAVQFVRDDRKGALWVGTAAGLDVVDRQSHRVIAHVPLSPSPRGMAFHEDRAGVFWIIYGSDGQLGAFDRGGNTLSIWRPSSGQADADPVMFTALLEDRDGTMWFGTQNHGILKLDRVHRRFIRYTSEPSDPNSLSDRRVNVLYQDREGLIWAGLHQSEPNYFLPQRPSFQAIQVPGRTSTLVSGILRDRSGLVWLGLDRGMRTLDPDTWTYREVPLLAGVETTSVVEGEPGVLWIGTAGQGLRRFDQRTGQLRTFRYQAGRPGGLPSDFVEQVRIDGDGHVWAVTWRGLARWEPASEGFVTFMPPAAPQELTFHTATFARNGVVWIGSNLGVHRLDSGGAHFAWFRHDRNDATSLSNDRVNSIHEAADGSIWIGTQGGLNHWDANARPIARYSEAEGLPGTAVSCILEDDARQLWMSTDRGISRLNTPTGQFTAYGTADGLPGVNMTGWDTCARAASGEMLFGGFAGATAFFPKQVADRGYVPPTVLTRLRLLDSTFDSVSGPVTAVPIGHTDEIALRPSQSKFSIEFAALSFLSPGTNRFRYRLQGLQEEWTEAPDGQRAATYMAVPAGAYAFQVQGATRHGAWSDPAATLRIVMLPPWWASRPFFVLAGLAVAASLWAAYRIRVRQLTHAYNVRLEERWAERSRIARELHDTLLQSFQGLMFRLQAARDLLPSHAAKAVPVLDMALIQGEAAIDEARGAVTDLRSSEKVDQNVETGLSAIAAAAASLSTEETAPPWELVRTGPAREIHRTVLYEVYQVVREALSNAFRHARAEKITVTVRYGTDTFDITIADDGVGCDDTQLASARHRRRWGVQGMKERMEKLGGALELRGRPLEGTEVKLSVPASVAYRHG
jgi:signal transduction histidine kinase/ligand-binding sensor domain-containing protein